METTIDPFEKFKQEYWKKKTTKQRKGEILDTVQELTGIHRKAAVRKFKILQIRDTVAKESHPVKQGHPVIYDDTVTLALKDLWLFVDKLCGELLYPMIGEYIEQYKKEKKWKYSKNIELKLRFMSESTVKRRVRIFYKKDRDSFRKGKTTTKPAAIKTIIPIREKSWFEALVGDGQIDTVVHCGCFMRRYGVYAQFYGF